MAEVRALPRAIVVHYRDPTFSHEEALGDRGDERLPSRGRERDREAERQEEKRWRETQLAT